MIWLGKKRTPVTVTPPTPPRAGLGAIGELIREDVKAVMANDPAARNPVEVYTSYPGLHAIWLHRLAHHLWGEGKTTSARLVSNFNRAVTGIEIHPGAVLGRRVFIDHGMGVVIGETAVVGDDCLIYKGVVLGGTQLERTKRHPTLGSGVVVGSNACILGAIQIGDGARIGSGSVVVRDVPSGATAVGIPGRIVSTTDGAGPLDHGDLPDPVAELVRSMVDQIDALRARVELLESDDPCDEAQGEDDRRREALESIFFEDLGD